MADFDKIISKYNDRFLDYRCQYDRIEACLTKWGEMRTTLEMPDWVDEVVRPIAELLAPFFPGAEMNIIGPLGLGARVSIAFEKDGVYIGSITIEPNNSEDDWRFFYVDYSEIVGDYPPGSIGEMNGFNFDIKPLPDTTEELAYIARNE